ncbi:hypothetical protein SAMN05421642_11081 [Rhodococcoides kyotonense]|uniref:Antitoxin n=1 Tax=Rhodococcoides kyotonense TaxID=398843 RepID=A0A239KBP9_9NOCA|nr:hypothetical protein SAMN05421642_11081 [Rhodococcus kyotonensis]
MPTLQIDDLPEDVYTTLLRRTDEVHQSLETYVRNILVDAARRPTANEVFNRAASRTGGSVSPEDAADSVRHDRGPL